MHLRAVYSANRKAGAAPSILVIKLHKPIAAIGVKWNIVKSGFIQLETTGTYIII